MVHGHAGVHEDLRGARVAALAGGDERGAAEAVGAGHVRAVRQGHGEDLVQALGAGVEERRVLDVVLRVRVGAQVEQQCGDPRVIVPGGNDQRGLALGVAGLEVRAPAQRERGGVGVAARCGLQQFGVGVAAGRVGVVGGHGLLDQARLRRQPVAARQLERGGAVLLRGDREVTPCGDDHAHAVHEVGAVAPRGASGLVGEDERLVQSGPAEVVDVVDFHVMADEPADDVGVPALGRADETGAVVGVQRGHVGTVGESQVEQFGVPLRGGDEVGALHGVVGGVDIGTAGNELTRGGHIVGPRGGDELGVEPLLFLGAEGGRGGGRRGLGDDRGGGRLGRGGGIGRGVGGAGGEEQGQGGHADGGASSSRAVTDHVGSFRS